MPKLIHPKLSHEVRGVRFDVYNELGPLLQERFYQDAIVLGLEKKRIRCESEKAFHVGTRLPTPSLPTSCHD